MLSEDERRRQNERVRRAWEKEAAAYDGRMSWVERRLFGADNRPWVCSRASGTVLEVAVGTGLNLPYYRKDVELTGIDLSPAMLDIARSRAADLGRAVDLQEGDAHRLPFGDKSFDAVVCTFSPCNIPDLDGSIAEMNRVLRPGGRLLLLDHIRSSVLPIYWIQKAIEFFSLRFEGEHMTRRPLEYVTRNGFDIRELERSRLGVIERLSATKDT